MNSFIQFLVSLFMVTTLISNVSFGAQHVKDRDEQERVLSRKKGYVQDKPSLQLRRPSLQSQEVNLQRRPSLQSQGVNLQRRPSLSGYTAIVDILHAHQQKHPRRIG